MAAEAPRRSTRRRKREPNSLIASAAPIVAAKIRRPLGAEEWQGRAWDLYDAVGGLAYVAAYYRNALARMRLVPKKLTPTGGMEDVTDGPAVDVLTVFGGGPLAQRHLVGSMGVHLLVPGECFLVGRDVLDDAGQPTGVQTWAVHSIDEMRVTGGYYTLDIGDGQQERLDDDEVIVVRVWNPHPRRGWMSDSPVKHVLNDLARWVALDQWVNATIDSRLAGAGLVLLPNEITFPTADGGEGSGIVAFVQEMMEMMTGAIKDRNSAAAVVPYFAAIPGEHIGNVKHITFWTEFNEHVQPMWEQAAAAVEMGLSIPKGVMSGTLDSSHWSSWQIADETLKFHLEPAIQAVCQALTVGYYQPALEAGGMTGEQAKGYVVWYDPAELTQRPNTFPDDLELYDRGLLAGRVPLRSGGHDPVGDAATEVDLARLERVAAARSPVDSGSSDLGLSPQRPEPPAGVNTLRADAGITMPCDCNPEVLVAQVDALIVRALEIVGGRILGPLHKRTEARDAGPLIEAHVRHHTRPGPAVLFANLYAGAPLIAAQAGLDSSELTRAVDSYVRDTVTAMRPHDPGLTAGIVTGLLAPVG